MYGWQNADDRDERSTVLFKTEEEAIQDAGERYKDSWSEDIKVGEWKLYKEEFDELAQDALYSMEEARYSKDVVWAIEERNYSGYFQYRFSEYKYKNLNDRLKKVFLNFQREYGYEPNISVLTNIKKVEIK